MTFRPGASLDPSQVEDVRGRRVGGRGMAIGGGGGAVGLILVIAYLLLGGSPGDLGALSGVVVGDGSDVGPASTALANECQTGADANTRDDCRIVGYVNSVQAYWTDEFARSRPALPAGPDTASSPTRSRPAAAPRARRPARSTARPTSTSTSTSASSTSCETRFGAEGGPFAAGAT